MPSDELRPERPLPTDRCVVMGIVNVTPDSFSDGGRWSTTERAVGRGLSLWADGADIVDVGGESTRPGSDPVSEEVELARVVPVVDALARSGVRVSVDTTRASVAQRAVDVGAWMVNDVSGGMVDADMFGTVAELGVSMVLMHWRAPSRSMEHFAVYDDVVADVARELSARVDAAVRGGVRASQLVLDPGLGFAKHAHHNWQLLRRIDELRALGFPVLLGASRKRFLGTLLAGPDGSPRTPAERDDATAAVTAVAASGGVWGVRVHQVKANADAVRVAAQWHHGGF